MDLCLVIRSQGWESTEREKVKLTSPKQQQQQGTERALLNSENMSTKKLNLVMNSFNLVENPHQRTCPFSPKLPRVESLRGVG